MSKPHPMTLTLQREIAAREAVDPLFGPKLAAHEIYARVFDALRGERGVPIENLLGTLASLAGYACQVAVRLQAVREGLAEDARLVRIVTADGTSAWFGDALDAPLLESTHSVWSLAAGGAQSAGAANLPDPTPMFADIAARVGAPSFGIPTGAAGARLAAAPTQFVRVFWPGARPILADTCRNPMHWPVALSIALQRAIEQGASTINPNDALMLVMECAIPMATLDLGPLEAFALAERRPSA